MIVPTSLQWFGAEPFGPVCDARARITPPIGAPCTWCEEWIAVGDRGFVERGTFKAWHHECWMRMLVGSVAHQQHRCTCYGGDDEDAPELSRRGAARAALAEWLSQQQRR